MYLEIYEAESTHKADENKMMTLNSNYSEKDKFWLKPNLLVWTYNPQYESFIVMSKQKCPTYKDFQEYNLH